MSKATSRTVVIYTYMATPFRVGGPAETYTGTTIPYDMVDDVPLGRGYRGFVVKNPKRKCVHIAETTSGAIVGTGKTRAILRRVCRDVENGKPSVMRQQVSAAKGMAATAHMLGSAEFFDRFRQFDTRKTKA